MKLNGLSITSHHTNHELLIGIYDKALKCIFFFTLRNLGYTDNSYTFNINKPLLMVHFTEFFLRILEHRIWPQNVIPILKN